MTQPDDPNHLLERYRDAEKSSSNEMWVQKRRLAEAMRDVIERLVPSMAPEEELAAAADALERYAERLKRHPRLRSVLGHAESGLAGDVGAFFDQSPMIGLANPLAPPLRIYKTGERTAEAVGTFGSAYEGPPGSLHGGYVAAAFDEVLGYVQSLSGNPGFTGTLTVRYRSPTPLHTELRFKAEFLRTEGRKIFTSAQLFGDDVLCAEAEGLFISARPERLEALKERRAAQEARLSGGDTDDA